MVNVPVAGFQIPKIGDVGACSTTRVGQMGKWMARRDSVHRVGLGLDIQKCLR